MAKDKHITRCPISGTGNGDCTCHRRVGSTVEKQSILTTPAMICAEDRVGILVLALVEAAQGAGLPQERAEAVYTELLERYGMMGEGFADALLGEVERIVNM